MCIIVTAAEQQCGAVTMYWFCNSSQLEVQYHSSLNPELEYPILFQAQLFHAYCSDFFRSDAADVVSGTVV